MVNRIRSQAFRKARNGQLLNGSMAIGRYLGLWLNSTHRPSVGIRGEARSHAYHIAVDLNRYGAVKQVDIHHNAQRIFFADEYACQAGQRATIYEDRLSNVEMRPRLGGKPGRYYGPHARDLFGKNWRRGAIETYNRANAGRRTDR